MAKIKHIAIATKDPEKVAHVYRDVFDLRVVGRIDTDNSEGYFLSDGNVNLAIIKLKNEAVAGEEFGTEFSGLHHIGFQVDDIGLVEDKLKDADWSPWSEMNKALAKGTAEGYKGANSELRYTGPDGVLLSISHSGWVGTGST